MVDRVDHALDRSDGAGSKPNVSALTTYFGNGVATLSSATNGGRVLMGTLTRLDGVNLTLDAGSSLALGQLTAFTNGTLTISGRTETFSDLTNIDGASFMVTGGAQVSLPAVTSYTNGGGVSSLSASGGGTLTLDALTTIHGDKPACGCFMRKMYAPQMTTLSTRGSRTRPSVLVIPCRRAMKPSTQSVSAASAKTRDNALIAVLESSR